MGNSKWVSNEEAQEKNRTTIQGKWCIMYGVHHRIGMWRNHIEKALKEKNTIGSDEESTLHEHQWWYPNK